MLRFGTSPQRSLAETLSLLETERETAPFPEELPRVAIPLGCGLVVGNPWRVLGGSKGAEGLPTGTRIAITIERSQSAFLLLHTIASHCGLCLWHCVADGKAVAAFGAAACQHLPSVLAGHAGAEPVGVATLASAWLICPFHKGIPVMFLLKALLEERQKYTCFGNPSHVFLPDYRT